MAAKRTNPFLGHWRIFEMEQWGRATTSIWLFRATSSSRRTVLATSSSAPCKASRILASFVRRLSTSPRFWLAWASISFDPCAGCPPRSESGSGFHWSSVRWCSSLHRPVGSRPRAHPFRGTNQRPQSYGLVLIGSVVIQSIWRSRFSCSGSPAGATTPGCSSHSPRPQVS